MPGLSICPRPALSLGKSTYLFPKFLRTGYHRGPLAVWRGWQLAQQPPLSLRSLTAELSSTARIPPLDKQTVLCPMGLLPPAAVPPPHQPTPQFQRPCIPVYKLSAFKARKLDKHTHSSSRFPLRKHARTRKTFLPGSPKPLDHSVSN